MSRMVLKYGSYTHPDTIRIAPDVSREFTHDSIPYRKVYNYDISGTLYAANSTALKVLIDALIAAYATDNQDLRLYYPDGTTDTELTILAANMLYTRIAKPPQIDGTGASAVYDVKWPYSISIEAVKELTGSNVIVEFSDDFDIQNAELAPNTAIKQPLKGKFKKFDTSQYGQCTATQFGKSVGLLAYPTPATPKWPSARILNANDLKYAIRERNPGNANRLFEVTWNYQFISEDELTA